MAGQIRPAIGFAEKLNWPDGWTHNPPQCCIKKMEKISQRVMGVEAIANPIPVSGSNQRCIPGSVRFSPSFLPSRKVGGLQIRRCQGFAVAHYGFTLGALALKPSDFCNNGVHTRFTFRISSSHHLQIHLGGEKIPFLVRRKLVTADHPPTIMGINTTSAFSGTGVFLKNGRETSLPFKRTTAYCFGFSTYSSISSTSIPGRQGNFLSSTVITQQHHFLLKRPSLPGSLSPGV